MFSLKYVIVQPCRRGGPEKRYVNMKEKNIIFFANFSVFCSCIGVIPYQMRMHGAPLRYPLKNSGITNSLQNNIFSARQKSFKSYLCISCHTCNVYTIIHIHFLFIFCHSAVLLETRAFTVQKKFNCHFAPQKFVLDNLFETLRIAKPYYYYFPDEDKTLKPLH